MLLTCARQIRILYNEIVDPPSLPFKSPTLSWGSSLSNQMVKVRLVSACCKTQAKYIQRHADYQHRMAATYGPRLKVLDADLEEPAPKLGTRTRLSCVHLSLIIEHYIIPFRAFVPSAPNRLIVNCFDLINIWRTSGRVATRGYSCFQCLSTLFPRHNTESV